MKVLQFELGTVEHNKIISNGRQLAIRADMIHSIVTDTDATGGCVLVPMYGDNNPSAEAYYYIAEPHDPCVSRWKKGIE
jgi:hypothetical protein